MRMEKIKSIKKTGVKNFMYDITVEDNHNFFANGINIHNCDYRGEIKVVLANYSDVDFLVEAGDRIAQFIPIQQQETTLLQAMNLEATERGTNGFGSTGV